MNRSSSASGNIPASFSLLASSLSRSLVTLFKNQNKLFIEKIIKKEKWILF